MMISAYVIARYSAPFIVLRVYMQYTIELSQQPSIISILQMRTLRQREIKSLFKVSHQSQDSNLSL